MHQNASNYKNLQKFTKKSTNTRKNLQKFTIFQGLNNSTMRFQPKNEDPQPNSPKISPKNATQKST